MEATREDAQAMCVRPDVRAEEPGELEEPDGACPWPRWSVLQSAGPAGARSVGWAVDPEGNRFELWEPKPTTWVRPGHGSGGATTDRTSQTQPALWIISADIAVLTPG